MRSEEFTGAAPEMKKPTLWLSSEDLYGLGDVKVTIARVHRHHDVEFDAGRKEKIVHALEFVGKEKQLVINATNRKMLMFRFGREVTQWVGKQIVLYVDDNVRLAGKKVCGIRIR